MKRIFFFLFASAIFFAPLQVLAQGSGGGGDPDDVPIDGGIGILLAAGAAYGAKRLAEKEKGAKPDA